MLYQKEENAIQDSFSLRFINAKIVNDTGVVELDELIKGIIFDDRRTVRIGFKDADVAEEFLCYLGEKAK